MRIFMENATLETVRHGDIITLNGLEWCPASSPSPSEARVKTALRRPVDWVDRVDRVAGHATQVPTSQPANRNAHQPIPLRDSSSNSTLPCTLLCATPL